jgi:hypothetical protein
MSIFCGFTSDACTEIEPGVPESALMDRVISPKTTRRISWRVPPAVSSSEIRVRPWKPCLGPMPRIRALQPWPPESWRSCEPWKGDSILRPKVFITNANLLRLTTEQRLRTFLEDHRPATISFVHFADGVLTLIETATAEEANRVVVALASIRLGADALALVRGDSPQGQQLAQRFTELKERELERNWMNRQPSWYN